MSNVPANSSNPAMAKGPMRFLRIGQAIATIGEIAVSAYLAYQVLAPHQYCYYNSFTNSDDCVTTGGGVYGGIGAFVMFNCVWNILTLLVLFFAPRFIKGGLSLLVITAIDGFAMFLWTIGAISWAAETGTYSVVADIVTIFAFATSLLFVATFVLNLRAFLRARAAGKDVKSLSQSDSPVPAASFDCYNGNTSADAYANYDKNPAAAYYPQRPNDYQHRPEAVHQV